MVAHVIVIWVWAANGRPYDIICADSFDAVRRVVPQGTFSCGFAAIHLVAPYGIDFIKRYTKMKKGKP